MFGRVLEFGDGVRKRSGEKGKDRAASRRIGQSDRTSLSQ